MTCPRPKSRRAMGAIVCQHVAVASCEISVCFCSVYRHWQRLAVSKIFLQTDEFEDWATKVLWLNRSLQDSCHRRKLQHQQCCRFSPTHCTSHDLVYGVRSKQHTSHKCGDELGVNKRAGHVKASPRKEEASCGMSMCCKALLLRLRWMLAAQRLWPSDAFRFMDTLQQPYLKSKIARRSLSMKHASAPMIG